MPKAMRCDQCGAEVTFDTQKQVMRCEFCGSTYLVETETAVKPWEAEEVIIPFATDEGQVNRYFSDWVKKGLFKPGDLSALLQRSPLQGIYIPTWNYSFEATTNWSGEKRFTRSEPYTDSQGNRQTRSVEYWEPRSGNRHEFYNLFIAASSGLTNEEVMKLAPFPLESAVPYAVEYFAGKQAEVPHKSPDQGWGEAQTQAEESERAAVYREVDRISYFTTQFYNETHRLVYVPIWLSGYYYKQKYYRVLINGRTGEVQGQKPVSAIKVLIAIVLGLAVVAGIILLVSNLK